MSKQKESIAKQTPSSINKDAPKCMGSARLAGQEVVVSGERAMARAVETVKLIKSLKYG